MVEMIIIYFEIIDNEFGGDKYFFDGYFDNFIEAQRFMTENRSAGNVIKIVGGGWRTTDHPYNR